MPGWPIGHLSFVATQRRRGVLELESKSDCEHEDRLPLRFEVMLGGGLVLGRLCDYAKAPTGSFPGQSFDRGPHPRRF